METHAWELPCGLAFKNTAKITAPHMLALRQIAWLNLTGSQSAALRLITVSSALVKKKKKKNPDNLLHQQSTEGRDGETV